MSAAVGVRDPARAVVFSGGGARGAYEAGVLRFVFEDLQRALGRPCAPEIALGTSVGAIHACYLAATAQGAPDRWTRLRDHWLALDLDQFLRLDLWGRWRLPWSASGSDAAARQRGLLDTAAIERLIRGVVPWDGIARNLADGRLRALGVITTELATGRAIAFVEGGPVDPALWAHDHSVAAREARLGAEHVLASTAIPLLFPAVRLGSDWHVDGALRLNTPLAPAIHLGAERMLVIALRDSADDVAARRSGTPGRDGLVTVLGRVLGALLLDRLESDLGRMQFVNSILERGAGAFGADFLPRLNRDGGRALRRIETLVIRPSQNLGELAREVAREQRRRGALSRRARLFLDRIADSAADPELLSLLLFDPAYFEALMQLGYRDARGHESALASLFDG